MKQDIQQVDSSAVVRIPPPSEARFTTILNNVGNGLMIGAAPVVAVNLYDHLTKRTISEEMQIRREKWGIAMAVVGVTLGVVLGEIEGRRLQTYRNKMSDKLVEVEKDLTDTKTELKSWKDIVKSEKTGMGASSDSKER